MNSLPLLGPAALLCLAGCSHGEAAVRSAAAPGGGPAGEIDREVLTRELRAAAGEAGQDLQQGGLPFGRILDASLMALLGVVGEPDGEGSDLVYPIASADGVTVTLAVLPPTEEQERFEIRLRGPRIFGGLPQGLEPARSQELDLGFALASDQRLRWASFLFKTLDDPGPEATARLLGAGPVQIGTAVQYRPGEPLVWQPLTLKVEAGPEGYALLHRNLGERRQRRPPEPSELARLDEITEILGQFRRTR